MFYGPVDCTEICIIWHLKTNDQSIRNDGVYKVHIITHKFDTEQIISYE